VEKKEDKYRQPESALVPPAPKDTEPNYECEHCHEGCPHQWFMFIPSVGNRWEPNHHRNKPAAHDLMEFLYHGV
jgi:hypothetical protein